MSLDSQVNTVVGPFGQFDQCSYDVECNYRDAVSGNCIFETCILQNSEQPKTETLWYFKCIICDNIDCIQPNQMKGFICSECISRMQAAEKKPFTCVFCGKEQSTHTKMGIFGQVCDECFSKLWRAINCKNCGNA